MQLFKLRYLLLWRAGTRSKIRVVVFVTYHAILLLLAMMAFNGAMAISLVQLPVEVKFRLVGISMWVVYVGTISSAIFVGIGGEGTFSAAGLRRYPLSNWQRQYYSHLITLGTPVWIGCLMFSTSCALMFSWACKSSILWRLPAAFAFFCTNYLSAGVLASLLRFTIARRAWLVGGTALLTALLFAAQAPVSVPGCIGLLKLWSPPAVFTALLRSQAPPFVLSRWMALLGWVVILSLLFDLCSEERALAGTNRHREFLARLHTPKELGK